LRLTAAHSASRRASHDRERSSMRCVLAIVLVAAVAGCTSSRPIESSRDELREHLSACTQQFGYDPAHFSVDEHHLAPAEREWRECAYAAVEKFLVPRSLAPDRYRELIAEDRQMTADVDSGNLTRTQRRQRIEAMLDLIDRREQDLQRQQQADRLRRAQE